MKMNLRLEIRDYPPPTPPKEGSSFPLGRIGIGNERWLSPLERGGGVFLGIEIKQLTDNQ